MGVGGSTQPRLTALSHGAGCACKIGAAELAAVRELLPAIGHPDLLVGLDPPDDAAVYRLSDELALVQTIDFFTPIVDDPFDFGRIAATNALSDIYAMGAQPLMALNVLAFPLERLGRDVLAQILLGGATVARAAGALLAGGHSIDDPEPKYGMTVIGTVHPRAIVTKAGGVAGDDLFLSKPLGGGLLMTAAKRDLAEATSIAAGVEVMTTLNAAAAAAAVHAGVHAMTDVTGFGLLGHLHELCAASGVAAEVEAGCVPALASVLELARDPRCVSGGSGANARHAAAFTTWHADVEPVRRTLLTDAMTSGGLLPAGPPGTAAPALGVRIGRLLAGAPGTITVR